MAKNSVRDYSATNSSNTDIQSIDISEGCSPAGINNAIREVMVDLKNVSTGAVALETPSADQLNVDNLRLDGNTISSTDTNGNVTIDPTGTGVVDVVGTLQSDGLTVDGDVTLNDGSPNLRLQDSDVSRYMDVAYGTRVASFTNRMAGGEDIDTVEPWYSFRFADDGETREVVKIDHDGHTYLLKTYANTTGGSANVHIGTSGELFRSTSSQRYKNTIADATHGLTELLALRPVTYKHNGNGDTVFGGLIAEEVHDAGLTEFVDYSQDADGNDQPEALHYANMVSLCIKAIQEQQATITALTARITALEAE